MVEAGRAGAAGTEAQEAARAVATRVPGTPFLRWSSRTHSVAGVQAELARIWASMAHDAPGDGKDPERRIAARSSVMNLVVVAGRGETAERAAAVVHALTGRHPSRTLIVTPADPDGPSWLDAQVQAHCVLPTRDSPETCAELVFMTVGGESGQHLSACVAPLLIHDLPVTLWWPGEPRFESRQATGLLTMADRILVDGSSFAGDGLARLTTLASLPAAFHVAVADFAMLRQSRWREAIASSFDLPTLQPFLGGIRRIAVEYTAHDGGPRMTNIVRPLYHVAWLASRLGLEVVEPLEPGTEPWSGYRALLRQGRRHVAVELRPIESPAAGGTTLEVEIKARQGSANLDLRVTGHADGLTVAAMLDNEPMTEREFLAPRRRETDLLAETIEDGGEDHISSGALEMAAALVTGHPRPRAA